MRPPCRACLRAHFAVRHLSSTSNERRTPFWKPKRGYVAAGTLGVLTGLGAWWFANDDQPLSLHSFSPVKIISSEPTGANTKTLRLKISDKTLADVSFPKPIWSIFIKDSDIQIERPFTPLLDSPTDGELELWVKKYADSEMGRWVHSRPVGDSIEIRGPHQTWAWKENTWDRVLMISGGTGITPFHQLLHHIFSSDAPTSVSTEFTLLHGYRDTDELPPNSVMQRLSNWAAVNPNKLRITTFIEHGAGSVQFPGVKTGRVTELDIRNALDKAEGKKTLVLVCGPERMIDALAGPKSRDGSQGPVGGVLARIPGKFEVYKL